MMHVNDASFGAPGAIIADRFRPLPHTQVTIDEGFWAPRLQANRDHTIPHIYRQCLETGRIGAFRLDMDPSPEVRRQRYPVVFYDSDLAKWIEAASYSLATHPDSALDAQLDEVITLIAGAQQPDGYLNTWFTAVEPESRWRNLRDWHELYCAGHLIEAGVAHFEATGKGTLLDVVCRYADYIGATFGPAPGQRRGYPGHPEIELALVRLYRATGQRRYLDLSRYFVDERGRRPHYYDQEARERGEDPTAYRSPSYEYQQAQCPVREQDEVVGHAVRAAYLYSAMADLAAEDGDATLLVACTRLWRHLTTRRMYVTGGIGTSPHNEGFTSDYDLPNESAYAETCAGIALIFWAQRLLRIDCNRRYADVLELALYNAVLSGVSLDGTRFFYDNPLASTGSHHRQEWFGCPCCPPNLARLLASLGGYLYAQTDDEAIVHLYAQSNAHFRFGGQAVTLRQETRYPWEGTVTFQVNTDGPANFGLRLRLPSWCRAPHLAVNSTSVDLATTEQDGYACIRRTWRNGDSVILDLPMPVERVYAHPDVRADVGSATLQRGPLVYCLEQIDQASVPLAWILLPAQTDLVPHFEPELLGGVVVLAGQGAALADAGWEDTLYRPAPLEARPFAIRAIPYYAWDNRAAGPMTVWIREQPDTHGRIS